MSSKKIQQIPLDLNWHAGMAVSQHQFQQNDIRIQQTFNVHLGLINEYHYGLLSIEIDKVVLNEGIFRVNEMEAIFKDGLIFSYNPQKTKNIKPLEINFSDIETGNEFFIYLCIAEYSEDTSPILGEPARYYSIEGESISDINIKDLVVKIPRLFPNAFLHIGSCPPEFCIGFPIAKMMNVEGLISEKVWSYPCLFLKQESVIMQKCVKVSTSMREKAAYLTDKLRMRSDGVDSYDVEKLLSILLFSLPQIENAVSSHAIKPYEMYKCLLNVLGFVATLMPESIPPVLPPYNHEDMDESFNQVLVLIEHYMSVIDRGFVIHQFKQREKIYSIYLSNEDISKFRDGKLLIGVCCSKNVDSLKVEKWIEDSAIVSEFAVDEVRTKRIKGAARSLAGDDKILAVTPGIGVIVFEIDIDSNFITGGQNLYIFNQCVLKEEIPKNVVLYIPRK